MVSAENLRPQPQSENPYIAGLLGDQAFKQGYVITVALQANNGDGGSYGGTLWAANGAKDAIIAAAAAWSAVANVTINISSNNYHAGQNRSQYTWVERLSDLGDTVLGQHDFPGTGDLFGDYNNQSEFFTAANNKAGGYSFLTFLHELGHGLGLSHPFDGPATLPGVEIPYDSGDNDLNTVFGTVMSYNDGVDNNLKDLAYGWPTTPMAYDIAAIQHLYGANMSTAAGDDVYRLPTGNGAGVGWICIWDAGGIDTMSAEGAPDGAIIDLRPASLLNERSGNGHESRLGIGGSGSVDGGFFIAHGVVIENAIGSEFKDIIYGNDADNVLIGNGGEDTIWAGAGDDEVDGGSGFNELHGEDGNDRITASGGGSFYGEAGDDYLFASNDGASLYGGDGDDELQGGVNRDYIEGGSGKDKISAGGGNNTVRGGDGDDHIEAGSGDDDITGGDGNDFIESGAGNDILDGGLGDDILIGGLGDDHYYLDSPDDQIIELLGEGYDTVSVGTDYVLPESIEEIEVRSGAHNIVGNSLGNIIRFIDINHEIDITNIHGMGGNDTILSSGSLYGDDGDDILSEWSESTRLIDGGSGNDKIRAGLGNQYIDGGSGDDQIGLRYWDASPWYGPSSVRGSQDNSTQIYGGDGDDTIVLYGYYDFDGTGAPVQNTGPVNLLLFYFANDRIDGGDGYDVLHIGTQLDFRGTIASIERIEFFVPTGYRNYSPPTQLSGLTAPAVLILKDAQSAQIAPGTILAGTGTIHVQLDEAGAFDGSGWLFDDGADVRIQALGSAGDDQMVGTSHSDLLIANEGDDILVGGAGNDRLDGGAGDDMLNGGLGDDVYTVDAIGDLVFEALGEGTDEVISSASYYLYANIEKLTLAAQAGDIFGVGNDLANLMTGNEGANLLIGWGGADELHGGGGNDALFGMTGNDSLYGDSSIDYLVGGLGNDRLEGGDDPDALYGQAGDDALFGGSSFDTDILVGGDGNDRLFANSGKGDYDLIDGGAGDDEYWVDTGDDLTFEAPDGGTDTVHANVAGANNGVYLYANVENLILEGKTAFGVGNELDNVLTGSASANWLLGGAGDDIIDGKGGNDVLFGEAGADTFVFQPGSGGDLIGDFTVGEDLIDLTAYGYSWAQLEAGFGENEGTSFVDLANGDFIVLSGVAMASLTEANFILV